MNPETQDLLDSANEAIIFLTKLLPLAHSQLSRVDFAEVNRQLKRLDDVIPRLEQLSKV